MSAAEGIAAIAAWVRASSPAVISRKGSEGHVRGPWAVMLPVAPDSPAGEVDLSTLGAQGLPLLVAQEALPAPVLANRLAWSAVSLPAVSNRLRHLLVHRRGDASWGLPADMIAVGITAPEQSLNDALAAEGLSVDLAAVPVLGIPLYAVTVRDRAAVQAVCRASYPVPA